MSYPGSMGISKNPMGCRHMLLVLFVVCPATLIKLFKYLFFRLVLFIFLFYLASTADTIEGGVRSATTTTTVEADPDAPLLSVTVSVTVESAWFVKV